MKYLTILFVACFLAFCDTTWKYPFTELGANWVNVVFQSMPTGIRYHNHIGVTGPWTVVGYAYSGLLTFPADIDSITIEIQSNWLHYGTMWDASSWSYLWITALTPESNTVFSDTVFHYCWDGSGFSHSDSLSISETLVLPENTLELNTSCHQSANGEFWSVYLTWELSEMVIIGHGCSSLSRSTWAGVKSSFN